MVHGIALDRQSEVTHIHSVLLQSSYSLSVTDHYGVQDTGELTNLYNKHLQAFSELIAKTHDSAELSDRVMSLLPYLKTLAAQHLKALAVYKKSAENATVEFPALHRELFATEFTTQ